MNNNDEAFNIEEISRDLRLTEQSFFRKSIADLRKRYQSTFIFVILAAVFTGVAYATLLCCKFLGTGHCPIH